MAGRGRGLRHKWERRERRQVGLQFLVLNRKLSDIFECFLLVFVIYCSRYIVQVERALQSYLCSSGIVPAS